MMRSDSLVTYVPEFSIPPSIHLGASLLGALGLGSIPVAVKVLPVGEKIPWPIIGLASLLLGYTGATRFSSLIEQAIMGKMQRDQVNKLILQKYLAEQNQMIPMLPPMQLLPYSALYQAYANLPVL